LSRYDDVILREMYREYGTPCDTLISDQTQLLPFAADYASRTGQCVEPSELARRLLTLRKMGEAKGGLPRLRRS
jgi:hypothetical protein